MARPVVSRITGSRHASSEPSSLDNAENACFSFLNVCAEVTASVDAVHSTGERSLAVDAIIDHTPSGNISLVRTPVHPWFRLIQATKVPKNQPQSLQGERIPSRPSLWVASYSSGDQPQMAAKKNGWQKFCLSVTNMQTPSPVDRRQAT